MNKRETNFWSRLWFAPVLIALLSLTGLLSALSGDGIWDVLSWVSLSIPCLVIVFYIIKGLHFK